MADGPYRRRAEGVDEGEESRECPKCGLTNPPRAQRCDCGWDFESARLAPSYLAARDAARADRGGKANTRLVVGAVLFVAGLGLTLWSSSSGSGVYVFYGAIFVGALNVFRGLTQR